MRYLFVIFTMSACLLGATSIASNNHAMLKNVSTPTETPVEYIEFTTPLVIQPRR